MANDAIPLVSTLIEAGNVDTVYRDVYLERARAVLAPTLSLEDFHGIEQSRAALTELPLTIARALEQANWPLVKELSQRADTLKQVVESKRKLVETARGVYAVTDIRLDPFSPGLGQFIRLPTRDLSALQVRVVEQLSTLEQTDLPWKEFYARRRTALQTRVHVDAGKVTASAGAASAMNPREAAAQALKVGDMKRLEKLADSLMAAVTPQASESASAATVGAMPAGEPAGQDLLVSYSVDTLTRARQLGLALRHLEPRIELASLRQYAWSPLSEASGHVDIQRLPLPPGSPVGLREGVELFILFPLVNSGGARYLPRLVAEDVLVEDFPDPEEGEQPPVSELLAALGLPGRRGLSRTAIEQALLMHGAQVLEKELSLDPRVFRLVCIPSDLHLRLGEAEGWGRQPFWTHFDGYLLKAADRIQALAGGDVRFGGLNDLLGVSRDYDSNHLVARFAIVQRERMAAW